VYSLDGLIKESKYRFNFEAKGFNTKSGKKKKKKKEKREG